MVIMYYPERILPITIILFINNIFFCTCVPNSPCPSIFLYKYHNNIWYGELKILVPNTTTKNIQLEVAYFSRTLIKTEIKNTLNILESEKQFAYNIENKIPVTFILSFPFPQDPPHLSEIILNGHTICTGPYDDEAIIKPRITKNVTIKKTYEIVRVSVNNKKPEVYMTERTQPLSTKITDNQSNKINRIYTPNDNSNTCGVKTESLTTLHLIVNGIDAKKQPWLVALFDNDPQRPSFFCAGSLISNQFVVTAAHCTHRKPYIILKLGARDVTSLNEPGGIIRISSVIVNHPEYQSHSSHADISVIKMSEVVFFDNNIKPICLWPNSYLDEQIIVGRNAKIYGWGNDVNGRLTLEAPKETNLIIKSFNECKRMPLLESVISDKTICAIGSNLISGPCLGDSGGGLYILVNKKWTIRGVISSAIGKEDSRTCDVENYFSVYTDTGKYFDWISNIVETY